jgi:L-aminopeptidase/D-esterase-like protein
MFTWNVVQMDRLASDGFVVTVHYTVNAVDGDYTASTYGTVSYAQENKAYTPFANLTKEQVIGWIKDSLGQESVETALIAQIEALKNPVKESGLPW